jgi:hypothetical protein
MKILKFVVCCLVSYKTLNWAFKNIEYCLSDEEYKNFESWDQVREIVMTHFFVVDYHSSVFYDCSTQVNTSTATERLLGQ